MERTFASSPPQTLKQHDIFYEVDNYLMLSVYMKSTTDAHKEAVVKKHGRYITLLPFQALSNIFVASYGRTQWINLQVG